MKYNSIVSLLVILIFSSGLIAAQPNRGEQRGRQQLMKMLDLTEEQQAKIADMRLQLHKELIPLRDKIQNLNSDLKLAITEEEFDEAKVKKIISQVSDLREEIHLKMTLHQRDVRNLLTPEQQKKFDLHMLSMGDHGKRPERGFHRDRYGRPGPMQDNR
jgi:Spy/CpxP family protein refolding chaperone